MGKVNILIGIDCDVPRSDNLNTKENNLVIAKDVFEFLTNTNSILNKLDIKRTYFICGLFLEYMEKIFGGRALRESFGIGSPLSEVADHTYSHQIFKHIPSRPNIINMPLYKILDEYRYNTTLFRRVFNNDYSRRGLRTPLGHYNGLTGELEMLSALKSEGVLYISSDLRDSFNSIYPPLLDGAKPRQPYYYECGLLEIPSHGWQDTAFSRTTSSPINRRVPQSYAEILSYYRELFITAQSISNQFATPFYVGLVLHPAAMVLYDTERNFWHDLYKMSVELDVGFLQYCDLLNLYG